MPTLLGAHAKIDDTAVLPDGVLVGRFLTFPLLRKYLGYSGEDFAATMGVTPATVSRWENDREPMGSTAERLLRLMSVRDLPIEEYPTDRLRAVATEGEPPRFRARLAGKTWHAEEMSS